MLVLLSCFMATDFAQGCDFVNFTSYSKVGDDVGRNVYTLVPSLLCCLSGVGGKGRVRYWQNGEDSPRDATEGTEFTEDRKTTEFNMN
jgi:hypothetical protein